MMKKILIPLILTILLFSSLKSFASGFSFYLSSIEQQEESPLKENNEFKDLELGYSSFSVLNFNKNITRSISYQNEAQPSDLAISIATPPPNLS